MLPSNLHRIKSRIEYVIPSDNIIVLVWLSDLTKKNLISLASFSTSEYDFSDNKVNG